MIFSVHIYMDSNCGFLKEKKKIKFGMNNNLWKAKTKYNLESDKNEFYRVLMLKYVCEQNMNWWRIKLKIKYTHSPFGTVLIICYMIYVIPLQHCIVFMQYIMVFIFLNGYIYGSWIHMIITLWPYLS